VNTCVHNDIDIIYIKLATIQSVDSETITILATMIGDSITLTLIIDSF